MSDEEAIETETAITDGALVPSTTGWVMLPATVRQRMDEIEEYRAIMVEGEDYGVIPGTQKPTLFQPGADTLCKAAGLWQADPEFVERTEDWDAPFFYYLVKVRVRDDAGRYWTGTGSCNSRESKYASKFVPLFTLSPEGKERAELEGWPQEIRKSKAGNNVAWVKAPNDDLYSIVNTIQKMAVKRAYVAATLRATGAHRIFTQDLEDMIPATVDGEYREVPATAAPAPKAAPAAPVPPKTAPTSPAQTDLDARPSVAGQHKTLHTLLSAVFGKDERVAYEWVKARAPEAAAHPTQLHFTPLSMGKAQDLTKLLQEERRTRAKPAPAEQTPGLGLDA